MMVWLYPAALAGLAAAAGPIIVHLLRRRQARRIVIPTVRFVPVLDASAVRFRIPSDPLLLVLRMSIVVCAALALARPLFLTDLRTAAWAERIARVVIVDTSESARGAVDRAAIATESSSADPVITIETEDIGPSLKRASAWLAQTPPARREIVVLSDFQRGALTHEAVSAIPPEIGLRLVRMVPATMEPNPVVVQVLSPVGVLDGRVQLDEDRTLVTYVRQARFEGLQVLASPADADGVASLRRVVSAAGARAPSAAQPIVIRFRGAAPLPSSASSARGWSSGPGQRLLRSPSVSGLPIEVSASGEALMVDVDADPRSLDAAQVMKAALDARVDPRALAEREIERIPEAALGAWSREPGRPAMDAWRQSETSDARWLWTAALLLLVVETLIRRSAVERPRSVEAHAA